MTTMDNGDYCEPVVPVPLTTQIDALDYNMHHKYRGVCLILDHESFKPSGITKNLAPRVGTEVDSESLAKLFESLGFDVVLRKNLTVHGVREILKQISLLDHAQNDCLAVFILTHGDHGFLYSYEARYPIDLLFKPFIGNRCPTLVGKPKLFFIQACQGNRLDRGVPVSIDATDAAHYFRLPNYADFLIAYSTLPGYYSFRNTENGSWFIRALVEIFQSATHKFDLLSMMTMICHRVAYYYCSNASDPNQSGMKQTPCITSMLTRRVFFPPKTLHI